VIFLAALALLTLGAIAIVLGDALLDRDMPEETNDAR
jgi:hypothetical protein